jgi:GDP-L-fucose synthase
MSVIVTGARGLLGSEVINLSVDAIGIASTDCNLTESAWLIEQIASASPDHKTVIHCAARVGGVKANTDYVAEFFDDNMKMNMNVLDTCKESNLKLVSVLSTCIYPDAPYVNYPLTEDQLHLGPPHHSNFGYAYAKRMLEVQSRAYRQQFGCNFISAVPNNLYGPNDNYDLEAGHVVPALIRKFHEAQLRGDDKVVIWGTGSPLRDFTFARDAASIILWLAANYDGPEPINIGNPEEVSIRKLVELIGEEMNFKGTAVFDSTKPDGQYRKPCSNAKLRSLGWDGEYVSLRDGLRETIRSFKIRYPDVRGVKR